MGEVDEIIPKINSRYKEPIWENKIVYDTNVNRLESLYFWIIDFLKGPYSDVEKISDTFTASPGSTYFADLGARATKMQEEGMKIMGTISMVVKTVINLIYDLKNFDLVLKSYDKAKSDDMKEKKEGLLALKERWLSNVDMQRGNGSINYMTQSYNFTTLRPAFFAAESVEHVEKMDLNDLVKRILIPRVGEFFDWVDLSEAELRKRYEIEKVHLRSQIDSLKLYSSWVKPYLVAAQQLGMKESKEAGLVSVFGSMILELSLLASKKIEDLPPGLSTADIRGFYKILTVDFKFRAYPTPQLPFAGRVEIAFKSYVLNEDEKLLLEKMREDEAVGSMLNIAKNLTEGSLKQLTADIDRFLSPKEEEKKEETMFKGIIKDFKRTFVGQSWTERMEEEKKKEEKEKKEKEDKKKKLIKEGVSSDSYEESATRQAAEVEAANTSFSTFDVFKKSQGMASFPSPFDEPEVIGRIRARMAEIAAAEKK